MHCSVELLNYSWMRRFFLDDTTSTWKMSQTQAIDSLRGSRRISSLSAKLMLLGDAWDS